MNDVLKIFLSMSLSGSLLILIFFAGKHFLKDRVSRQWQYYIWLIVIARLLLPFAPETNLMGTLFQTIDHTIVPSDTVQLSKQNQVDFVNIPDTTPVDGEQGNVKQTETPPVYQPVNDIITLMFHNVWLVWLTVALILFIQKVTVYKSFLRYVEAGQIPISDTERLDRLAVIGEQAGVKKPVELCLNPLMSSPLLIGFFNPCIVLPSTDISEKDFRYIVLHELTHYRRRDMFYKWLVQVTVCLHWFNPLVYLMSREINKACEFSCDEGIISKSDFNGAQAYGKTLLDAMAKAGNYKECLASVTLNENKEILKERLGAIMKFKKPTRLTAAISVALVFVLCFGATVTGAYAAAPSGNEAIQLGQQAKTKGDTTTTDITSSQVIREGEVYYIFCDGADESNKPTGGSVGNAAAFVLVRKDSYTSISGFTNLEKLVDEVTEQCDDMLKKRLITQDEARLIVEVATKIQSGNDSEFIDYAKETSHMGEYAEWGIEKKNDAYFYKNERLRVFMDLRADDSFVNFNYDKLGSIDLRLVRNQRGNIIKAEYLTRAEADEILGGLETTHSNLPVEDEDISRLTKAEVPVEVLDVINSCETGKWYLIQGNKYQYIYFDGVPNNYAWQPEIDKDSASVGIYDIGKSTGTYVLLAIPNNLKLTISYNSKQVAYTTVAGSNNVND